MTNKFLQFVRFKTGLENADIEKFTFKENCDLIEMYAEEEHQSKIKAVSENEMLNAQLDFTNSLDEYLDGTQKGIEVGMNWFKEQLLKE